MKAWQEPLVRIWSQSGKWRIPQFQSSLSKIGSFTNQKASAVCRRGWQRKAVGSHDSVLDRRGKSAHFSPLQCLFFSPCLSAVIREDEALVRRTAGGMHFSSSLPLSLILPKRLNVFETKLSHFDVHGSHHNEI